MYLSKTYLFHTTTSTINFQINKLTIFLAIRFFRRRVAEILCSINASIQTIKRFSKINKVFINMFKIFQDNPDLKSCLYNNLRFNFDQLMAVYDKIK